MEIKWNPMLIKKHQDTIQDCQSQSQSSLRLIILLFVLFAGVKVFKIYKARGMDAPCGLASENTVLQGEYQRLQEQYELNISLISSRSIEDWASLWGNDIYPIQMKELVLSNKYDLKLFNVWIFSFHYYRYSSSNAINKYRTLLLEAQTKFQGSSKDQYTKTLLEDVINSIISK